MVDLRAGMSQACAMSLAIDVARAWTRGDLRREDWLRPIPADCLDELLAAAALQRAKPLPLVLNTPDRFRLDACRAFMAGVRRTLDRGPGFALLDRLPLEPLGRDGAELAYWLAASLIARPVAQKFDGGSFIYEVSDTGRPVGNGVRRDSTNLDIQFHTDNAYNAAPPDYVGLLCLRPAQSGGVSAIGSFATAYRRLAERQPEALPRLFQPFLFDRQREHTPDESPVARHPVFRDRGGLSVQFSDFLIRAGHRLAGEPLDAAGDRALQALSAVLEAPELAVEFDFEPGQMQFLDNRICGHKRTAFADHADPAAKRLLLRLWLRDWGDRSYAG